MSAARTAEVIGAFIATLVISTQFVAADQTVFAEDTDGSDDLTPPGVAFLYAKVSATLRTSDCKYYSWSHTPGSSYAAPDPPWSWDWEGVNKGDFVRDEGHTETWLLKDGQPYVYRARAVLPEQPAPEPGEPQPPCII